MAIRQFAADIWRWLWLIALSGLIAGAIAYGISTMTVPVYAASTRLLINQAPASKLTSDYNSLLTSERLAKTYAEMLRTRPVMAAVIAQLQLSTTPDALAQHIIVSVVRDTQLIEVTVEDTSPQRAADIANTIVDVFAQQNHDLQLSRYTSIQQGLEQEQAQLQTNIDQTNASIAQLESANAPADTQERNRLQAALSGYRDRAANLNASLEDMRLAMVQASDTINAIETAQAEVTPVRPHTFANVLLAAMAGMMLAIATVGVTGYLDDTVKSTEDVEKLTNVVSLAAIGSIPAQVRASGPIAMMSGYSPIAESYRMLRANLDFAAIDQRLRTIVVTSSGPGEGKSTTIASLAIAIAQSGKRVILVDTDLRRPTLHRIFGTSNGQGVTTALFANNTQSLDDHLLATKIETLRLMPSGPLPPNPAELLGSQRMTTLLQQLVMQADVVLFDTPPLLAVVDAALLASVCDATLLVAAATTTRASALKRAKDQLSQSGARMVRAVLNRVESSASGYYGGYYAYESAPAPKQPKRRFGSKSAKADQKGHAIQSGTINPAPKFEPAQRPNPVGQAIDAGTFRSN